MNYENKKVFIYGWARSGRAVARFLHQKGAQLFLYTDNPIPENEVPDYLTVVDNIDETYDLVVKNPGIFYQKPILQRAQELGIEILTEVQVGLDYFKGDVIAITGSNGKTTTTMLIAQMLKGVSGDQVQVAGNIGKPVTELLYENADFKTLVLEISSFQLMGTPRIKPDIALINNIFASHLDYHGSRENYLEAKKQVFKNQDSNDLLVFNAADPLTSTFVDELSTKDKAPRIATFSSQNPSVTGAHFENDTLVFDKQEIISKADILLKGDANYQNIAAATTVVMNYNNQAVGSIRSVLRNFKGAEHRLEFVGTFNGIKVYNDSKATDIEATQSALQSFPTDQIVWIAGGLDRGDDLSRLIPDLKQVQTAFVYGQTKDKLVEIAKNAGIQNIAVVENLKDAVSHAVQIAQNGQVILFSPAAASWDQFDNFETRGKEFKDTIKEEFSK
ncbi:MAG: UDP-N-acetylmuramoyl-L-alanine--D-glutamate ligase [Lactobacillaceae bacterium]|jgi:UDP-N-acetylmuramoylalanine--D-glutamate ligase|nr:UDP-N-acetylmuramoyl-L-alanine--D-glutamate ligase [Lactobacillaceae bacterium]